MKEMNKTTKITTLVILILVVAAGSFYGGMMLGKKQNKNGFPGGNFVGQHQGMMAGQQAKGGNRGAGGFISGEIISVENKSITIKTQNGGSKIIFFSDSTSIGKAITGSFTDLITGQFITAGGTPNSDGSITATQIQIRPQDSTADKNQPIGQPAPNQEPVPSPVQ